MQCKAGSFEATRNIVPFLPQLTDVVALYSCSSPLRDVVAPAMLEHLSTDHWRYPDSSSNSIRRDDYGDDDVDRANATNNNDCGQNNTNIRRSTYTNNNTITTPQMIAHVAFHGARSATSCIKVRSVDISCRQQEEQEFMMMLDDDVVAAAATTRSSNHNNTRNVAVSGSRSFSQQQQFLSSSSSPAMTRQSWTSPKSRTMMTQGDRGGGDSARGGGAVRDQELISICKWCHNLESLTADRCVLITDSGLYQAGVCLARNEHFERISLRQCRSLTNLKGLSLCQTLQFIDCSLTAVDPAGIAPLQWLPNLIEVVLVRCPRLANIDVLSKSPSLQRIDITACPVSDVGALAELRTLKRLKADATKIELLAPLSNSTSLEWISLRNVLANEFELEALAAIPTLQHICIYNANLDDNNSVDFLNLFRGISSLDVGQLGVRTADLSRGMPELQKLAMRYCPIVDTIYIQKMWSKSLRSLDLLNASLLGDEGLQGIERLVNLHYLNLAGTAVTDAIVKRAISKMTRLGHLDLSNTRVTSVSCLAGGKDEQEEERQAMIMMNHNQHDDADAVVDVVDVVDVADGVDDDDSAAGDGGGGGLRCLKTLVLECCRRFTERGLVGIGTLPSLEELDLSCTAVRDLTKGGIISEPWASLKSLSLRGVLYAPRGLVAFCVDTCPQLAVLNLPEVMVGGCSSLSSQQGDEEERGNEGFLGAAQEIRSNRYIDVRT